VDGLVSEGSGENIFVVWRGKIYTPGVHYSILAGITRDSVMTLARELGYEVVENAVPREALYVADELFFTGTAAEVTPIRSVDGVPVGNGGRGEVTHRIQEAYFNEVKGAHPRHPEWHLGVYP
jgi:branched-chain amino acid aminotransferase